MPYTSSQFTIVQTKNVLCFFALSKILVSFTIVQTIKKFRVFLLLKILVYILPDYLFLFRKVDCIYN